MIYSETPLFLAQSYEDAYSDYLRSLTSAGFAHWDFVVLTASGPQQAEGFRAQLARRRDAGFLPPYTRFAVLPDPDGKRVGSGGATLGVLRYIAEQTGSADFSDLRLLVIHSGGDSRRVPQYSALGKLFSPVPRELPDGRASALFDEFMIGMAGVPSRMKEGMLLVSGDVLLLFNPLQIDYSGKGAAAISFKEDVQVGKDHGVFLCGEDGVVKRFLHKQSVESLYGYGAVNAQNCVDIDTGAVIFSPEMMRSLYSLVSADGRPDDVAFGRYVNETVRLSLYGDFLFPLASDSTFEEFLREKPEGVPCEELSEARAKIWDILRPFRLKLLRLAPAKFIHFGTTGELLELMTEGVNEYGILGWSKTVNSSLDGEAVSGYNSILSPKAVHGNNCYLEDSYVHGGAVLGDRVLLSYVDVRASVIPSDVVVHGLKQRSGRFIVRIYGIHDDPKCTLHENASLLGRPLSAFLEKYGLDESDLWDGADRSLWTARLYPECGAMDEALAASLNLCRLLQGEGEPAAWKNSVRRSLCSGFHAADPSALTDWDGRMRELVSMERFSGMIRDKVPARQAAQTFHSDHLTQVQREWLQRSLKDADYGEAMRLRYYVGCALGGEAGEKQLAESFACIREAVLQGSAPLLRLNRDCRIVCDFCRVKLPLRVNWGGGWSDTPPYCNENGGTVLNAAILLNGRRPVEVTLTKLRERKLVFDSRDMDVHGEFTQLAALQETGDPYDPFALQKAALLACGILPAAGGDLRQICMRLGGGFLMQTEVTGVPKGSGLGTSSILAAACVKAIFEFTGVRYTQEELCSRVLCMEQLMSTGGGWQDQVGGLVPGIKYITSRPGLRQEVKVQRVELPEEAAGELNGRFALIYTGQRRLARHLLRDVVGSYIGNEPKSLAALNEIQRVAALMRFELERGRIDDFARLLSRHWELSKEIDSGSTNTLIEHIFATVEELIDGKMICGAGGGGFLQVVLKKGVTKERLRARLKSVFQDSEIDVWNCGLF